MALRLGICTTRAGTVATTTGNIIARTQGGSLAAVSVAASSRVSLARLAGLATRARAGQGDNNPPVTDGGDERDHSAEERSPGDGVSSIMADLAGGGGGGGALVDRAFDLLASSDRDAALVDTDGLDAATKIEVDAVTSLAGMDPMSLVGNEVRSMGKNIVKLLETEHPMLKRVADYYFDAEGKKVRPAIVLLVARAAAAAEKAAAATTGGSADASNGVGDGISRSQFLESDGYVLPAQQRLAEITEMIHTASLVHDDVIDEADTRRGKASVNQAFGNKMAVLAGDFLLARASLELARLRNPDVIELVSTVIANLVEGEFMQLRAAKANNVLGVRNFQNYIRKTYLKTASLIAHSAQASVMLMPSGSAEAGSAERERNDRMAAGAHAYGKNLGIAFQLVDDTLDFVSTSADLGKPSEGADLRLGLATAPVLFAAESYPELNAMMERKFDRPGDVETALELVARSDGVEKTRALAAEHGAKANQALDDGFGVSPAVHALKAITHKVLTRKK